MKDKYTWTVEFSVAPCWVADGFEMTDSIAINMLGNHLGFANIGTELEAKVIKAPDPKAIRKEQGYKD